MLSSDRNEVKYLHCWTTLYQGTSGWGKEDGGIKADRRKEGGRQREEGERREAREKGKEKGREGEMKEKGEHTHSQELASL